jgi:predicted nucleotide-binding protein (sugar kinase/HSP70/actin superfamily)
VSHPTWARWFARTPSARSASPAEREARARLRIGIPRILNLWSTHRFWLGFFDALGVPPQRLVFSSDTSEEQFREHGRGRGTVDCCWPVKCAAAHFGELMFGLKRKVDVLFVPLIYSLPSVLRGHAVDSLACPRVMAGPEMARAGFTREKDLFAEAGIRYVAPFVTFAEPALLPRQLHEALAEVLPGLTPAETEAAVAAGLAALERFDAGLRARSREVLARAAAADSPVILVLARPYHMDPGIGHEIEADLQARGYPILWGQHLPTDPDLMDWLFGEEVAAGLIRSPFDIADVWPSSYSANTNEILWGAKVAARLPWITCVVRLTSYECGMDQPTFTPVQSIVEHSGTLFFSFQELDATKPAGSVKIRVETIAHYLERASPGIIARKRALLPGACPLTAQAAQPAEA